MGSRCDSRRALASPPVKAGRVVVLREAELALYRAQEVGPESIRTFTHALNAEIEPIEFLS